MNTNGDDPVRDWDLDSLGEYTRGLQTKLVELKSWNDAERAHSREVEDERDQYMADIIELQHHHDQLKRENIKLVARVTELESIEKQLRLLI